MQITEVINIEDLKEPYDRLSEFLSLDEIIKLANIYGGRQIKFRKNNDDIKTDYPELIASIGIEKALKVLKILGGLWIYFPELKRSCTDKIKSLIISEYNGYNHLQLARKFGYTERHIRNIVAGKVKRQPLIDENQLSLFGDGL